VSTYTLNTGIELITTGDKAGTWGTTTNNNLDIIDRALNGVKSITLSGTEKTLSTTDGLDSSSVSEGAFKLLVLGGSPSGLNTITISPSDANKIYFVYNNSGQTARFIQGTGTTDGTKNVDIPNGSAKIIYADGGGSGATVKDFTNLLNIGLGGTAVTSTAAELNLLDGVTATTSELNYVDTTAGTVAASKAVVVDSNKDTSGIRNLTITGTLNSGTPALLATAQEFTATQNFNETTLTDASTIAWDASANQVTKVTLTANRTLGAATNQVQGGVYILTLIQDGTGSRTITFNSIYKFSSSVPTLSTSASARDILVFLSDGTNMYEIGRSLNPVVTS
jgi:hypothetical protein